MGKLTVGLHNNQQPANEWYNSECMLLLHGAHVSLCCFHSIVCLTQAKKKTNKKRIDIIEYCSDSKSITDSLLILLSYLTGTALRVTIILKTYVQTDSILYGQICVHKIFLLFDVAGVRVVTQKRLWMLWGCPSLHLLAHDLWLCLWIGRLLWWFPCS